jgi:pimeloyl-ACP methyl ester carboxylesterase
MSPTIYSRTRGELSGHAVRGAVALALICLLLAFQLNAYAEDQAGVANKAAASDQPNPQEIEVQFRNGDVMLAGILLSPPARMGTHPAVVIIHGSGPNEGSEYRIYAEQFRRAGVAALIYDKRGSGKSTGDWRYRTLDQLTGDALAAVAFLKSRPEINPQQIGLWGISQGSWIVPLAASRSKDVAFVITVAGDGVSPTQQEMYHKDEMFRHLGYSESARETALKFWKLIFDWLVLVADGKFPVPQGFMEPELSGAYLGLNHDPVPDWEKVKQPALLIYGEEDKLTPVAESIARIDAALKRAGNRDYTVIVFPKAAHNITLGKTGLEFDWDKGFAPHYFEKMNAWVLERTRGPVPSQPENPTGQYHSSSDFQAGGRYGPLPWYGRALAQLGLILFFALVFLSGLIVWAIRAAKTLSRSKPSATLAQSARSARRLAVVVSGLGLVLLCGFLLFITQAVFPQGMSFMESYRIPMTLRLLPLVGLLSAGLIVWLIVLTIRAWRDIQSRAARLHQALIALAALLFIPWLYYWNLLGLWF